MNEQLLYAKSIVKDQPDEALRICNTLLSESFDNQIGQQSLFMIGFIMMEAERYGLAYHIYQRCAQLRPDISEIWSNMGMCLEENDPERAKRYFKKAVQLDPKNYRAMANHALMCLQTAEPKRCVELCNKALSLDSNLKAAAHNRSLARIMMRDWGGWEDYFDTLGVKHREARDYGVPDWDGEEGTVLVYGEQGVGDEIMFSSCLPDLLETNQIVFDCDSRLESLFRRTFPQIKVYGDRFKKESRAADQEFDYQCAIGQLPYYYRCSDDAFPGTPYLIPDPEQRIQWRALFDTFKGKKIGIAWRGGLKNTGEKRRSLEISDLEPIFSDENTYISLEYKHVEEDALEKYHLKSYPRITGKGGNIDDLAAMVAELDYVVTCCTTVVYVAGALGIPCYVLVPSSPGYRYHIEGQFPWYNSVHLERQIKDERWSSVAGRLSESIKARDVQNNDSCQEKAVELRALA